MRVMVLGMRRDPLRIVVVFDFFGGELLMARKIVLLVVDDLDERGGMIVSVLLIPEGCVI